MLRTGCCGRSLRRSTAILPNGCVVKVLSIRRGRGGELCSFGLILQLDCHVANANVHSVLIILESSCLVRARDVCSRSEHAYDLCGTRNLVKTLWRIRRASSAVITRIHSKQHYLRIDVWCYVSLCDGIKRRDEFKVNRLHKSTSNA
jgi:hypothetical protein